MCMSKHRNYFKSKLRRKHFLQNMFFLEVFFMLCVCIEVDGANQNEELAEEKEDLGL